jgi:hypothetical protein
MMTETSLFWICCLVEAQNELRKYFHFKFQVSGMRFRRDGIDKMF